MTNDIFKPLVNKLSGELLDDIAHRKLYATDASVYRELPLAVVYPKNKNDLRTIIDFASDKKIPLIPRTAGTSLGGQCVGDGLVIDMSKHMTGIIELNEKEHWVRVQPAVIRDDLNRFLKPYGLQFAPETSTANRAMIGGMVGNNSCGTNSIVYGTTRDHVLEAEVLLSDGALVKLGPLNARQFNEKLTEGGIEGDIYRQIQKELTHPDQVAEIRKEFPKASIHRRNTGYAVDVLLEEQPFNPQGKPFNFAKLLCGSEGTLAIATEIKLNLVPLPPKDKVVLCAHFHHLEESLRAVVLAMPHQPGACELMDKIILDCTKANIEQNKNRFFVQGDPEAILCVEFWGENREQALAKANKLVDEMKERGWGYHFPLLEGTDINKVWNLRKAGLGVLANIPGDKKAVAVIEDTAVAVEELPAYITEFSKMMEDFGQKSVYYAHAGAGELHLRPILDLKDPQDRKDFRAIAEASAHLVKKYGGSLSGEHGDGRVRGEFIPLMVGERNYQLFRRLKYTWDPNNIFNPGKIVDTPPMDTSLRYDEAQQTPEIDTVFDFSHVGGILRAAEKCNGSGDCRKSPGAGGTLCPSYQATRDEKDTTRARANILREYLTHSDKTNRFDHEEIYQVLDLCLNCKGCTSECPSNVDIPSMKAEFLHHYYKANGVPLRSQLFGNIASLNKIGALVPGLSNFMLGNPVLGGAFKKMIGVAPQREIPSFYKITLRDWFLKEKGKLHEQAAPNGGVYFFADEFTNYNDVEIGIKAIQLLTRLGYRVQMVDHAESGRAALSKGLLDVAQKAADTNVAVFSELLSADTPLVGIEPSGILTFRDEYPRLVAFYRRDDAHRIAPFCLQIEEFLAAEIKKGKISPELFTKATKTIKLHGHCHQKALSSVEHSAWILGLPSNYHVEIIPSGCCGMAGSFGYEAEHYDVSMKVGELVLFPAVRGAAQETIIAAPGTSCRHQIKDGTGRKAVHPIEVLYEALL